MVDVEGGDRDRQGQGEGEKAVNAAADAGTRAAEAAGEVTGIGASGPGQGEPPTGAPPARRRRWPWIVAAVLVTLLVGLRAALPTIVERGAAWASRNWLGLPVRIENADFDLLDGRIVLEGVRIAAEADAVEPFDAALEPPPIDPATALLHLDRISAHLSWGELADGHLHLSELVLEAPTVRVLRETDGEIDPLRHARPVAPTAEDEEEVAEEEPSEPMPVTIDTFALRAPDVVVVDVASGGNLLEFSLESFSLEAVSSVGSRFSLGGVGIEGPVLRVRRDLLLAEAKAVAAKPAAHAETAADAGTAAGEATADASTTAPDTAAQAAGAAKDAAAPAATAAKDEAATVADAGTTVPDAGTAAPDAATASTDSTASAGDAGTAAKDAVAVIGDAGTANTDASPAAPAEEEAGYRIDRIDIARATFTWVTDKGPLDVALGLHASGITADRGERFPIDVQLEIEKGRLGLKGEVGILPPSYTGSFSWEGLPFPPLLLASLPELAAWLRSADSTGNLTIDADVAGTKGPPSLRLSGRTTVDTLAVADPGGKEFALGFRKLEVEMRDVLVPLPEEGAPARTTRADLALVRLTEPKIHYTHPSPSLEAILGIGGASTPAGKPAPVGEAAEPATGAAKPGKAESAKPGKVDAAKPAAAAEKASASKSAPDAAKPAAESAPEATPPVDVTIALLELLGGDLEVVDTTVTPTATSTVRELFATVKDVHFPDPSLGDVQVKAVLPKASALTVKGHLAAGNVGEFTISLQKLDLPVFDPYARAAGAGLDAGQATLETRVKLKGPVVTVDNDLLLRRLGVSLRDPASFESSFGMPIDLVLALLRDPSGNIRLKIPVRVDEKGTSLDIGAIVASAIRQAIVGAVTAPLKMLGAVFGGGGDDDEGGAGLSMPTLPAVVGRDALAPDAASRVTALAKLLAERPSMAIALRGRTSTADIPLVAETMLVERVAAGDGLPDLDGAGLFARRRVSQAFARVGKGEERGLEGDDAALYDRYVAAMEVPSSRLDALAKERATRAREALLAAGVAAERVQVGDRESDGDAAVLVSLKGL